MTKKRIFNKEAFEANSHYLDGLSLDLSHINRWDVIEYIPDIVLDIRLDYSSVKEIRYIPPNVQYISINYTEIDKLPALPPSLITLDCDGAPITNLPDLPASIKFLSCENTLLCDIPDLPDQMTQLSLEYNYLPEWMQVSLYGAEDINQFMSKVNAYRRLDDFLSKLD